MSVSFEEGEHIILEVRKHWFVLLEHGILVIFLMFLPLVLYALIEALPIVFETDKSASAFFLFCYSVWLVILWVYIFFIWTDYYLDIWIITNKKIMAVEQLGLFRREISTLNLNMVQDVTTEVHGMIPTLLDFGDLQVETAGHSQIFRINKIAKPGDVRQKINMVLNRYHDTTKVHDDDPYEDLHDEKHAKI